MRKAPYALSTLYPEKCSLCGGNKTWVGIDGKGVCLQCAGAWVNKWRQTSFVVKHLIDNRDGLWCDKCGARERDMYLLGEVFACRECMKELIDGK